MKDYERYHIQEYFFRRLCDLADEEEKLVYAMRTKKGLLILADKLREISMEKRILERIYSDLRPFL